MKTGRPLKCMTFRCPNHSDEGIGFFVKVRRNNRELTAPKIRMNYDQNVGFICGTCYNFIVSASLQDAKAQAARNGYRIVAEKTLGEFKKIDQRCLTNIKKHQQECKANERHNNPNRQSRRR